MTNLKTIDSETLMNKPLQPLNFVVDTLISQGLHILPGSPKVGKSWLALWLAVTVAKGESVWGMQVKKGTTLYLCLEDSQLRISKYQASLSNCRFRMAISLAARRRSRWLNPKISAISGMRKPSWSI